MKHFYFILIALFSITSVNAQLPDESIAPDFEVTDLEGNTHRLYDLLDEGKTVILDIFATWCGPCWNYHVQHVLEDFYQAHGPNGDNTAFVMAIEGDGSTNPDCITGQNGCNDFTIGDWTDGISYPIIDASAVANAYNISYYPTIFMVHPNRLSYEIGQLNATELENALATRPTLEPGINPSITRFNGFDGSLCNDLWITAPYYLINNLGEETINSADIAVYKNGELIFEDSFSGQAGPYSVITEIQLPTQIVMENTKFTFEMTNINDNMDHSLIRDAYVTLETDNLINVSVQTDDEADISANYFVITAPSGDFVAVETISENNTSYNFDYVLDKTGCYNFVLYDNQGNGTNGTIIVSDSQGNIIYNNTDFAFETDFDFNVPSLLSSTSNIIENSDLSIYPNPASVSLLINIPFGFEATDMFITNLRGQKVQVKSGISNGTTNIDVHGIESGIYFLHVASESGTVVRKFIKQ